MALVCECNETIIYGLQLCNMCIQPVHATHECKHVERAHMKCHVVLCGRCLHQHGNHVGFVSCGIKSTCMGKPATGVLYGNIKNITGIRGCPIEYTCDDPGCRMEDPKTFCSRCAPYTTKTGHIYRCPDCTTRWLSNQTVPFDRDRVAMSAIDRKRRRTVRMRPPEPSGDLPFRFPGEPRMLEGPASGQYAKVNRVLFHSRSRRRLEF